MGTSREPDPFSHNAEMAIVGASRSIYVRGTTALLEASMLTEGHLSGVDARLDLRCIFYQNSYAPEDNPFLAHDFSRLDEPMPDLLGAVSHDWQIALSKGTTDRVEVLVDGENWFATGQAPSDKWLLLPVQKGRAKTAHRRFLQEWEAAHFIEPLFEEACDDALFDSDDVVLVDPKGYWDRLITELLARPDDLRELGDRMFEELTAELLTRDGFDARLTPKSRDGGYDVLALRRLGIVDLMYLVECKRYARARKVGVQVVRSLYGVVSRKRANAGLIVTTSSFSRPAQLERRDFGSQMALKDYDDIVQWMRNLRRGSG